MHLIAVTHGDKSDRERGRETKKQRALINNSKRRVVT